jgi:hypothetical protein
MFIFMIALVVIGLWVIAFGVEVFDETKSLFVPVASTLIGLAIIVFATGFAEIDYCQAGTLYTINNANEPVRLKPGIYWHLPIVQTVQMDNGSVICHAIWDFSSVK